MRCKTRVAILFIAGIVLSSLNSLSAQQVRENIQQWNSGSLILGVKSIPVRPQRGSEFCSISPFPYATELVQPNGRSFMGKIFTLNRITYLETIDGYTVMQDPADSYFKYAAQGADGNLYLSAIVVSEINARIPSENSMLAALNRHARYEGNALQAVLNRIQASEIPESSGLQAVFPPTGIRKALLLLIQFPDLAAVYTNANFNNYCNQVGYNVNGQTGSFRDFYLAASYGALTLNTDVGGWYTSTNNRATYGVQSLSSRQFLPAVALVRQAVDAAELSGVNYANYDGDGNGSVDVVMVIHAGRGAEESGNVADIWSHRWTLSANAMQVTYDGKLVNDYIIQAEKLGPTNMANIGVLCHEFGHALGLPDLYDTDGGSEGLGNWCLMAGGSWNNSGKTPPHPSVWCKDQLGWMNPTVLTGTGTINSMSYSQNSNASYRINTPVAQEYFLIENRQNFVWDAFLPAAGLCIYHIDETRTSNQNPARYWVNLEQADGLNHLNNDVNAGDIGDPYPGSSNNTSFSCSSNPNSNTYNGNSSAIAITAINSQAGNTMGFTYGTCCPTISVTNPATTTGTAGTAFSQTFTRTGGTGSVTFSTTSTLPTGLSLSATGVLSGTPTQTGTFPIVVRATDINLCFGNGPTYNLVIGCPTITVTNPATTTGTAGVAFSQTFTRTGGIGTVTFSTTSTLPTGLNLSTTGVLSGIPTQTGTFPIVVRATDANLCFGNGATYTLVINAPVCPTIIVSNPATTMGTAGSAFSQTFTASGGVSPYTFSTTSTLPTGLSLSTGGVLSGTPTQTGTFPIVVRATDANLCFGNGATYNLVIGCPTITVTNPATTTGTAGTAFSQTFTRTGGVGTVTFSTTSTLPTGISLSTGGVLSGTPTQTGTFPITVRATDANLCFGNGVTYNLVVGCPTITVTNPATTTGTSGVAFSQTFTRTGGVGTVTFSTTSTLPTGLSLSATGVLSGTPTQTGTFPIVVRATDANLCFGDGVTYSLVIGCPAITVTNPATTTGVSGSAFNQTFTASGGVAPYTFSTTSTIPAGLTLSTAGVLSGTPTQTGTFLIVVRATGTNLCFGDGNTYSLTINPPVCPAITVTNPSTTTGTTGSAFSQTFTASGGVAPYTFSTTSTLPTGLTLSTAGVLSGTPTQTGTFLIVVRATDVNFCFGDGNTYSLTINPPVCPTITVTNPATTTGVSGSAFNQTFTASGGVAPYTFTTTSTLPAGLSLSTAGVLSGIPTQTGTFPIVVNATDVNLCVGNGNTYNLTIGCPAITVTNPVTTTGAVNAAFSETFTQTGAAGGAIFTINTGTLPTGITLSTTGVLSGTPTQAGNFPITVRVTDGNGCTGTGSTYTLVIDPATCATVTGNISGTTTAAQNVATNSIITFTGTGGIPNYTFTYNISENGGPVGATQTISTTGGNNVATVAQSNAIAGTYVYNLLSVTDGNSCVQTPAPTGSVTITVIVGTPDLTNSQFFTTTQIAVSGTIDEIVAIRNVGTVATSAPVTFTITTYSPITGLTASQNPNPTVTIGFTTYTLDNANWTFNPATGTFTSNAGVFISPGTTKFIGVRISRVGGANGGVTHTATIPGGTGGGEAPVLNNSISNNMLKN